MVYAGAQATTADQLKQLLSLTNLTDDQIFVSNMEYLSHLTQLDLGVTLNVANKIFSNQGLLLQDRYQQILLKYFKSDFQSVDFSDSSKASQTINDYVDKETKNKIQNLLSPSDVSASTKLVLVNAIYFKGSWLYKFQDCQTHKEEFMLRDKTAKTIEMMRIRKKFLLKKNPAGLEAKVCELLYEGNSIAMTIILPDEGVSIEAIEAKLSSELLTNLLQTFDSTPTTVDLFMPKFKLEFKTEVTNAIKLFMKLFINLKC